jgi:EAL domain-containing protein (putative c-di-GMP-specific phosphodiesterase class I)
MQLLRERDRHSLLEYHSREPRVFGVELNSFERNELRGILTGLRWIGQSRAFRDELTFLVINLPDRIEPREIIEIADCAKSEGLSDRLCAIVSPHTHRLATTMALLQRAGIAILLGGVGRNSRFSDIADHRVSGVVIDYALLSHAYGDPHSASILDAILSLAGNLGLKTFANECATENEFNFALNTGVSYVSYGKTWGEATTLPTADLGRIPRVKLGSSASRQGRAT